MKRTIKATIFGAALAGALVLSTGGVAFAGEQDGKVSYDETTFYFNSNLAGSLSDFYYNQQNLAGRYFLTSGFTGYGVPVKNNAASVRNSYRAGGKTSRVYFNSLYGGAYDSIGANSWKNLVNTKNNNASFRWL